MSAAYIEHRPHATSEHVKTSHYVIIVNGKEVYGNFSTQKEAKEKACKEGHRPVHVARERHLQDHKNPAHWRSDPC